MSKNRIQELESLITQARNSYYNSQPTVSDKLFDAWVDELKTLSPKSKAVTDVGAPVTPSVWLKAKHQIPMGSLDKVNTPAELTKWAADMAGDEELFVTEKLDGISIECVYEDGNLIQAITRGDGETGEDITVNVVKMSGITSKLNGNVVSSQKNGVTFTAPNFTGSLRGEIIMKKSVHKTHFADKANPRNAASGVSKRLDGVGVEHLDILFYQALGDVDFQTEVSQFKWLKQQGVGVPNYWLMDDANAANKHWRDYQDTKRDKLDYDIDGLVIRINDLTKQAALGDKDMRPKGAIAFKFDNEARESTITDIIWQVGNSGRITPVAVVDPVSLVGATVTRASIYNMAYIQELGLDIGARVLVARANDVIPRIEELVKGTGNVAKGPDNCPACAGATLMVGENLTCTNSATCPAQVVGRIKNWVNELNILELGETVIEKLVAAGFVKDPSDLYKITVDNIASLDRMGEKSAKNVYESIWKNNPVALEIFLGGLSIPMIGSSTIKLLMEAGYTTLDDIIALNVDQIEAVKGIGPVKAESLVNGLDLYSDTIENLLANGVKIKDKIVGKLSGCKIAITGSTKIKRADLENFISNNGGENKSSVGKSCTHLVIADVNSTSSKAVTARKLGIKLIDEENLLNLAI